MLLHARAPPACACAGSSAPYAPPSLDPAAAGASYIIKVVGGAGELPQLLVVGGDSTASAAVAATTTNTCECSEAGQRKPGEPCSSTAVVKSISQFLRAVGKPDNVADGAAESAAASAEPPPAAPPAGAAPSEIVRAAAGVLGCTTESCILAHPAFREFVAAHAADGPGAPKVEAVEADLRTRFKPAGPRDSTQLLSNYDIDAVLQQWAATAFPRFFNYAFSMIDFEETGGPLARADVAGILQGRETQSLGPVGPVRRVCDTFACVLNTDVSTGRGKHWVSVFGDCRGGHWTVEYFNSAGNPPPKEVTRWLEATTARLVSHRAANPAVHGAGPVTPVVLTDVRHQNSSTECGNYALYYIRRRLEGAPPSTFQTDHIPDDAMIEFRKHLFRSGK